MANTLFPTFTHMCLKPPTVRVVLLDSCRLIHTVHIYIMNDSPHHPRGDETREIGDVLKKREQKIEQYKDCDFVGGLVKP